MARCVRFFGCPDLGAYADLPHAGFARPGPLEREALILEAVRIAVDLGVDVDARNGRGRTAAQAALGRGYDSVVEFLVAGGASLD